VDNCSQLLTAVASTIVLDLDLSFSGIRKKTMSDKKN